MHQRWSRCWRVNSHQGLAILIWFRVCFLLWIRVSRLSSSLQTRLILRSMLRGTQWVYLSLIREVKCIVQTMPQRTLGSKVRGGKSHNQKERLRKHRLDSLHRTAILRYCHPFRIASQLHPSQRRWRLRNFWESQSSKFKTLNKCQNLGVNRDRTSSDQSLCQQPHRLSIPWCRLDTRALIYVTQMRRLTFKNISSNPGRLCSNKS